MKEKEEPVSNLKPVPYFSGFVARLFFLLDISERKLALGLSQSSCHCGERLLNSGGAGAGEELTTVLGSAGKTVGAVTQEEGLGALENRVVGYIQTDGEDGDTLVAAVISPGAALGGLGASVSACGHTVCEEHHGMLTGRSTFSQYVDVVDAGVDEHLVGSGHGFAAIGVVDGASILETIGGGIVVESRPGGGYAAAYGGGFTAAGDGGYCSGLRFVLVENMARRTESTAGR